MTLRSFAERYVIWVAFAALETGAQISLKLASASIEHGIGFVQQAAQLADNGWLLTSLACDALNFLVWMQILQRHDLSLAVPASSICYIAIVLTSTLVLGEPVSGLQLVGLVAIGSGIALIVSE